MEEGMMKVKIDGFIRERAIDYIKKERLSGRPIKVPVLFQNETIMEVMGSDIPWIVKL